ncbi:hypothetical protein BDY19DRAFT_591459 [Irpex rosettiformis]|uniref:Uncharacterized protein n=1 Tax=Irpex rosettiformis TaxID=378272 RepID=A0ACB8UD74_9APHY|nr:hypothetical protein BDY19DRAFT_591459 [Irpex rosettiformis]
MHSLSEYVNKRVMFTLIVPQDVYPAPQAYECLPNVEFKKGGVLGVRLIDVLNPAFNGLDNPGSVPHMSIAAKNITLLLKWPGHSEWKEAVDVFDQACGVNSNTTRKIAQIVAQKIQIFWKDFHIEQYAGEIYTWRRSQIPIEKIVLLELRHVSQDSWQPVLAALP